MNETRQVPGDNRDRLIACYRAAIEAAMPGPAVERALSESGPPEARPWILAIGKAAAAMARAAAAFLARQGLLPAGGLVVTAAPAAVNGLDLVVGDHPFPGPGSARAADAVGRLCREIPAGRTVYLLLSGGASSLMAGPDAGLTIRDLRDASDQLLRSGLDIGGMNLVRKRLSRWAGGRLAVALQHATVLQLVVSDVIGDDLAAIGSGPAVPDPSTAAVALDLIDRVELRHRMPAAAIALLEEIRAGRRAELPNPRHPAFRTVTTRLVASNRDALAGAAREARRLGWEATVEPAPIRGEARDAGTAIAERLLQVPPSPVSRLLVIGGETTVHLGGATGRGGRCQELALAVALVLDRAPDRRITLLAAGTDGRDGPTDAAGAIVMGSTCRAIRECGIDPESALERHLSYDGLDAAGALLRVGQTGTNVMDLVLGLVTP
jgi:hydroxypyruvate reductase